LQLIFRKTGGIHTDASIWSGSPDAHHLRALVKYGAHSDERSVAAADSDAPVRRQVVAPYLRPNALTLAETLGQYFYYRYSAAFLLLGVCPDL
jgi:hypothetical protein